MANGLSERFGHYLPPTPEHTRAAITSGLVVTDTNVLLSTYRFAPAAREELLSAMEKLADRLWIPDQVALEFHRNRLTVIAGYDAAYQPVIEALDAHQAAVDEDISGKLKELANRVALSEDERDRLLSMVSSSLSEVRRSVVDFRAKHGLGDPLGSDPILERLQAIFEGKVGDPMDPAAYEKAQVEAKRRIDEKLPPGFRDSKSGDYLVWSQTLAEVSKRGLGALLFVTSDVKDDWYQIVKGRTVAARPELTLEAYSEANARLVMLNTSSFLFHAREHLNAAVSAETIRQAANPPEARNVESGHRPKRRGNSDGDLEEVDSAIAELTKRVDRREILIDSLVNQLARSRTGDPADDEKAAVLEDQLQHYTNGLRILRRRLGQLRTRRAEVLNELTGDLLDEIEELSGE